MAQMKRQRKDLGSQLEQACNDANGEFTREGMRGGAKCVTDDGTMFVKDGMARMETEERFIGYQSSGKVKDADNIMYDPDIDSIVAQASNPEKAEITIHNRKGEEEEDEGIY